MAQPDSRIPQPSGRRGWALAWLAIAVAYFAAARLGLSLTFVNASASPVWPPTGLAIAALLLLGPRAWPGITLGAYTANALTTGWGWPSLAIAAGNTAEALAAWWLVTTFAGGTGFLRTPWNVLRFAALGGLVAPLASATIGVGTLVASGNAPASAAWPIWTTWWLGDALGAILLAPALVSLASRGHIDSQRIPEAILVAAVLTALGVVVFSPVLDDAPALFLLLPLPVLAWAALRFGTTGATPAALFLALMAVFGTLGGHGPLAVADANLELLAVQAYIGGAGVASIALAALRPGPRPRAPHDEAAMLRRRSHATGTAIAGLLVGLGTLVLVGWFAGLAPLKAPIPGSASMKANTAVALVALGAALLASRDGPDGRTKRWALALAVVPVVIGALTLTEYLAGVDLHIDELLVQDDLSAIATSSPGRMSPLTALAFCALGPALLLRSRPGPARLASDILSMGASMIGLTALTGYVYDAFILSSATQVAPHTSVALLLAGFAVVMLDPSRGLGHLLVSPDVDGRLARSLPLGIIVLPLALGAARLELQRQGHITLEQGVALTVLGTTVLLALVTILTIGQAQRVLADRQAAQEALRKTLASVTQAEAVTGRGSWEWDVTTDRAVWSEGMYRLFGVDPKTFVNSNENFLAMVLPEDRPRMGEAIAQALARPGLFFQEYRLRRPDGQVRVLHGEGNVVPDPDGKARVVYGVVQDVTQVRALEEQKRRAEVEVARAQERFQRVFEASPVGISLSRADGRILDVNATFCSMSGYEKGEFLAPGFKALELYNDPAQRQGLLDDLIKSRKVHGREFDLRRKDGSVRNVVGSLEFIDIAGSTTILGLFQDVTDLRQAQLERNARFATEAELERLRRTEKFRTEFINSTSHELATPLTPLIINVHGLLDDPTLTEKQKRALQAIDRAVQRLRHLVSDMVGAADLQARSMTLDRRRLNLNRELRAAVASHQAAAVRAGLVLEDPEDTGETVSGDPVRLQLVLGHLLGNAIKFTPAGGKVWLAVRRQGDAVRVSVNDTGVGLSQQQIGSLWKAFSQAHDKSQRTESGSGLGLYVTKGIIELHGGEVGCSSPGPGKGSTFWFTLPLATGHVDPLAKSPGEDGAQGPKRDLNPGVGDPPA